MLYAWRLIVRQERCQHAEWLNLDKAARNQLRLHLAVLPAAVSLKAILYR